MGDDSVDMVRGCDLQQEGRRALDRDVCGGAGHDDVPHLWHPLECREGNLAAEPITGIDTTAIDDLVDVVVI